MEDRTMFKMIKYDKKAVFGQDKLPYRRRKGDDKGRKVLMGGFIIFAILIGLLYAAHFYVEKFDTTKDMIYSPATVSEYTDENGAKYTVNNIFSSYDNANFLHEKRAVSYNSLETLVGTKFDVSSLRDEFEFEVAKSYSNDIAEEYGVHRYNMYGRTNSLPIGELYVDKKTNTVIGIRAPYLTGADFRDVTLSGYSLSEMSRLKAFLTSPQTSYDNVFNMEYEGLYSATSSSAVPVERDGESLNLYYHAEFYTTKQATSIDDLIDFYSEDENGMNVYFAAFMNEKSYTLYRAISSYATAIVNE
jgi:hypothetical protein